MKLYDLMYECLNITYSSTKRSLNYAIKRQNDTLYIFFEHSNGRSDWLKNLNFPIKPYRRMNEQVWYAHRGFLSAWQDAEKAVSSAIMDNTVKRIITGGYSHGAAVALLCHEYIWFNRPDLRGSIDGVGFGCPRVVWGNPGREILLRFERFSVIRNEDDIVTHLPPAFLGYTHVGNLITIGKAGKYTKTEAHYPENILSELKEYDKSAEKESSYIWLSRKAPNYSPSYLNRGTDSPL